MSSGETTQGKQMLERVSPKKPEAPKEPVQLKAGAGIFIGGELWLITKYKTNKMTLKKIPGQAKKEKG